MNNGDQIVKIIKAAASLVVGLLSTYLSAKTLVKECSTSETVVDENPDSQSVEEV